MNKKDIALSVGGILASMVIAYLVYKMQKRDSDAAIAEAASNAAASAEQAQEAAQNAAYTSQAPYFYPANGSSYSQGTDSSNLPTASVSTPSDDDSSSLVSKVLSTFATANSGFTNSTSSTPASEILPTLPNTFADSTSTIPLTASSAQAGVPSNTISSVVSTGSGSTVSTGSNGSSSTENPITSNPITFEPVPIVSQNGDGSVAIGKPGTVIVGHPILATGFQD